MKRGWIGVDLDGTLARYDRWRGEDHIGEPIERIVDLIRTYREAGYEVRIMTARVSNPEGDRDVERVRALIQAYTLQHIGEVLPVTCCKDYGMIKLYDDRAVQVIANTGQIVRAPE